jgi:hypothetical protein
MATDVKPDDETYSGHRGTRYPDLFAALAAPFDSNEIKTRSGGAGRSLSYITASTVANRLDDVLGPESWDFEIAPWGNEALIGTLVIRLPDGKVIRKSNVGGKAGMQNADDDTKSAASDCLKRCAALAGVGRYLYNDGVPFFVRERLGEDGLAPEPQHSAPPSRQARQDSPGRDVAGGTERYQAQRGNAPDGRQGGQSYGPPRTGKGLFAWVKDAEAKYEVGLLKFLNGWAKLQDFPGRMVDWDESQVQQAYAEAQRKLAQVGARGPDEQELDERIPY